MGSIDTLPETTGLLVPEREVFGPPAIIAPSRGGVLLAFSARSVNQAMRVWTSLSVSTLSSPKWHVSWLNGLQSKGVKGFPAASGMPGLDMLDCGAFQLVFCPEVLGPLGLVKAHGRRPLEVCEDLEMCSSASGLWVRGLRVFDGLWRHGRIEPASGVDGWFHLLGSRLW